MERREIAERSKPLTVMHKRQCMARAQENTAEQPLRAYITDEPNSLFEKKTQKISYAKKSHMRNSPLLSRDTFRAVMERTASRTASTVAGVTK